MVVGTGSITVEGFNFRQLFIEAIDEETKTDDTGSRRRTKRRVVRKDPGEEFFTMVTSIQSIQALKLNFPDLTIKLDPVSLYAQALTDSVPFYKVPPRQWQDWLLRLVRHH
jgi:hypothetical protein